MENIKEMPPETISVSQFRSRCLSLLNEISRFKTGIILTKRGKAIAKLIPIGEPSNPSTLLGSVQYSSEEDLLAPEDDIWDADR